MPYSATLQHASLAPEWRTFSDAAAARAWLHGALSDLVDTLAAERRYLLAFDATEALTSLALARLNEPYWSYWSEEVGDWIVTLEADPDA